MTIVFWLWKNDISSINSAPSGIWNGLDSSLLMRICRSFYFLKIGKISDALDLISDEPSPPLEIYLLKAQALSLSGNYLEAVMLLKSIRDASKEIYAFVRSSFNINLRPRMAVISSRILQKRCLSSASILSFYTIAPPKSFPAPAWPRSSLRTSSTNLG